MSFLLDSLRVFVAELLVYPLAPLAVRQADAEGRLPQWARWMETVDDLGWGAGVYEPAIATIYAESGKEAALVAWLRRNKAYTLRAGLRANPAPGTPIKSSGSKEPPKFGPWRWSVDIGQWWERRYGFSFVKFHMSIRAGWKLTPYLDGWPADPATSATGIFIGASVRTDNWSE